MFHMFISYVYVENPRKGGSMSRSRKNFLLQCIADIGPNAMKGRDTPRDMV